MITCREMIEFLLAYASEELPPSERSEFDRHLAVCVSCVSYLKTYKETIVLEKVCFEDDEIPADVPEELVAAIVAARRKPS